MAATQVEQGPSRIQKGPFGRTIGRGHGKTEEVKHDNDLFPHGHLSMQIIGRSGCGKTALLMSLVPNIAHLREVMVCSLIIGSPVYDDIQHFCEVDSDPPINYSFTNDPLEASQLLDGIVARLRDLHGDNDEDGQGSDPYASGLVIMDDFTMKKSGNSDPYNNFCVMVGSIGRNFNVHSIFITQTATTVPVTFRGNVNMRFIFAMNEQWTWRSIAADMKLNKHLEDEEWQQLFDIIQTENHSYLMLVAKGEEGGIYLYTRSKCPDGRPIPVRTSEEAMSELGLKDDTRLKTLLKDLVRAAKSTGPLASSDYRKTADRLNTYIATLVRMYQCSRDKIMAEVRAHIQEMVGEKQLYIDLR